MTGRGCATAAARRGLPTPLAPREISFLPTSTGTLVRDCTTVRVRSPNRKERVERGLGEDSLSLSLSLSLSVNRKNCRDGRRAT